MPRKPSAHAQLDQLRQKAAAERMKQRELEAELAAANREAEEASGATTAAYAEDDQRAVTRSRKAETAALAKVDDLEHRLAAAGLRVDRA